MRVVATALVFALLATMVPSAFAGARENILAASKGVETVLGEPLKPDGAVLNAATEERDFCLGDDYCRGEAPERIFVSSQGQLVTVMPTLRASPGTYEKVCMGVLDGLTGSEIHPDYIVDTVRRAFELAGQTGEAHGKLWDVQINFRRGGSDQLVWCEFVRWQQPAD